MDNSPEHLRACLVRDIAAQPKRAGFFHLYAKHHGEEEARRLATEVRAEIERRKNGLDLFANAD